MFKGNSTTGGVDAKALRGVRGLTLRLWLLAGCAFVVAGITAASLNVLAGCNAWIVGAGHWSRAEQNAVHALERYLLNRDPAELDAARMALAIPEGYRNARLLMEQPSPDLGKVRAELVSSPNNNADIDLIIRLYLCCSRLPFLSQAIKDWRAGEAGVERLVEITNYLDQARLSNDVEQVDWAAMRRELMDLDVSIDGHVTGFLDGLTSGARRLHTLSLLLCLLTLMLVVATTLTAKRRIRIRLVADEQRFRAAFHQASVGMARLRLDGHFLEVNATLAQILGYRPEELHGRALADVVHCEDLNCTSSGKINWSLQRRPGELRFIRANGAMIWVRWSASEVAASGATDCVLAVVEDVSESHRLAGELARQASHDALTGLLNRREVERRLTELLALPREPGTRHALCYMDLDHFKLINDTFGHAEGDRMLCHFVQQVATRLRPGDWFGRLGGDEFAILFVDASIDEARKVLETVQVSLSGPLGDNIGRPLAPGCSFGLVEVDETESDPNALLSAADMACYAAKEEGRNRIRCFDSEDIAKALRRQRSHWIGVVKQAIADQRLVLHAQKIRVVGEEDRLQYEVLPRLRGTDGELVAAGEFLPSIEHYGMGRMLDVYVIGRLLPTLASNVEHLQRLDLCHVNVSAQSVAQPSFLSFVLGQLDRFPTLARHLCFEITETAVIGNVDCARRFVEAVRARGCVVALDDFGSGLSSFGYLKQFKVDILKIDGAFVRDIANDPVDRATVCSIVQLATSLGIAVVAECVETPAAVAELERIGVERLQGYAIHRPAPLSEQLETTPVSLA